MALEPEERAGLLTHPYLMATFAYTAASSPIHRGVFLARGVLGRSLRPPPEAVAPLAPDLHAELTTRERVDAANQPEGVPDRATAMINPLGFTLEHFDAVGRFREEEKGKPIDATGTYQTRAGETVKFSGVRDLASFLAGSEEAHAAFVAAAVPLPGQAAGPGLRPAGADGTARVLRAPRFQHPQAGGRDHGDLGLDARGTAEPKPQAPRFPWPTRH